MGCHVTKMINSGLIESDGGHPHLLVYDGWTSSTFFEAKVMRVTSLVLNYPHRSVKRVERNWR